MKALFNSKVPTLHIIQPISRAALMSQPRGQNWFVIAMNTLDYFLVPLSHKLLEFSPLKSWPKIAHKWAFSRCAPTTALGSTEPIHTWRSCKTSLHNFPTTGRLADLTSKQQSTLLVFAFYFLKNSVTVCPWLALNLWFTFPSAGIIGMQHTWQASIVSVCRDDVTDCHQDVICYLFRGNLFLVLFCFVLYAPEQGWWFFLPTRRPWGLNWGH